MTYPLTYLILPLPAVSNLLSVAGFVRGFGGVTEDENITSGGSFFQGKSKLMSIIAKQVPSHPGYTSSIGSWCHFQILLSSCIY